MITTLLWFAVGLVLGAFFPNKIKPRALAAWATIRGWFARKP